MNKKHSYESVVEYYLKENCKLLETEYINSSTKMKYICNCGNQSETTYSHFRNGRRCKKCSTNKMIKNRKLSYEYVYHYFKEQGCELIDEKYIRAQDKLKYKCSCGNISYIQFNNFQNNQRCMECSGNKKFTFEFVKNYIESEGYILLSEEYKNNMSKLLVRCDKDHIFKVRFSSFYNNKTRCKQCFKDNNFGKNHPNYKEDRTIKLRTKYLSFNLSKIKLLSDDPNYNEYLNNKSNYNIDHIFPRKAFIDNNLDNIYNKYLIKEICNSRDNLRIINKKENKSKSSKYNQQEFLDWFNDKLRNNKCKIQNQHDTKLIKILM